MRILLIRTSSLGDIVHCLPALRRCAGTYPTAHIGWVVEDVFAPLLARDPDLDDVLEVGCAAGAARRSTPPRCGRCGRASAD